MTEMFGAEPAWGDPAPDDGGPAPDDDGPVEPNAGEHMPGEIDLGGGIKLRINPAMFRTIMHSPQITAAVDERCSDIAKAANAIAVDPEARYEYTVSNNPENIRARGRVRPANYKAVVDDALNSTLLKALGTVGPTDVGDPKPTSEPVESAAAETAAPEVAEVAEAVIEVL